MLVRRLIGSILTLLTLHLNVLGADFACAKHGSAADESAHAMAMSTDDASEMDESHKHAMPEVATADAHRMSGDAGVPVVGGHQPCDLPVQPNCCKALTSCSVVFASGDELDVASAIFSRESLAIDAMRTPLSANAAPEPPPPKA